MQLSLILEEAVVGSQQREKLCSEMNTTAANDSIQTTTQNGAAPRKLRNSNVFVITLQMWLTSKITTHLVSSGSRRRKGVSAHVYASKSVSCDPPGQRPPVPRLDHLETSGFVHLWLRQLLQREKQMSKSVTAAACVATPWTWLNLGLEAGDKHWRLQTC